MITLTVISLNGAPHDGRLSADFDELGGTIGRADTNQLVLPDPDRAISRVHAQVVYRSGEYAVVDRGSNPIMVNGRAVGSGREMAIREGDQLQIGGFILAVKQQQGASARSNDDPFADLLGPAAGARPAAGKNVGLIDPLAAFATAPTPQTSPGFYTRAAPPTPAPASAPGGMSSLGGIPDDWDPFAPDPAPAARAGAQDLAQSLGRKGGGGGQFGLDGGAAAPAALIPDLPGGAGNASSLDALFGLKPGTGGDPLANSLLDAPMAKPNMAASADPLQSLNSVGQASAAALPDNLSDLQRPFMAPPAVDARPRQDLNPTPARAPTPAPAAPVIPAIPSGAVLSWDSPSGGDGHTVIRPSGRAPVASPAANVLPEDASPFADLAAFAPAPPPVAVPVPSPAAVYAPSSTPAPASARGSAASNTASNSDVAALLAAFREGLAMPTLQMDALTPELMRLIGQLLHESARGTVDLLVARAALKREVRAEATMIAARENNPLKFSPSAEAALQHLLAPPVRGFMAAAPAMRDAFDDLRAHQFGFIAGMRAALAGVLSRFRPAELEGRLTKTSGLKSLLPGSRKAAMWEIFVEHYAQISSEAEDDFHSLFGKAFLQAYEEHIDQLHKDRA